jgi:hypothetical protein
MRKTNHLKAGRRSLKISGDTRQKSVVFVFYFSRNLPIEGFEEVSTPSRAGFIPMGKLMGGIAT